MLAELSSFFFVCMNSVYYECIYLFKQCFDSINLQGKKIPKLMNQTKISAKTNVGTYVESNLLNHFRHNCF